MSFFRTVHEDDGRAALPCAALVSDLVPLPCPAPLIISTLLVDFARPGFDTKNYITCLDIHMVQKAQTLRLRRCAGTWRGPRAA